MTIRSIAVAAALLAAGFSANALTLNSAGTKSNSVFALSQEAQDLFNANGGYIEPKGNATVIGDPATSWVFNLPVTTIVINNSLKVASGSAVGSALDIVRETTKAIYIVNLANFTLDYINKKVLADVTASGATTKQTAVYSFNPVNPLALKYKFPLTITGHEVLDKLILTPTSVTTLMTGLGLALGGDLQNTVAAADFGTLTQDISTDARKPAVSTTPYVATP